MTDEEREVGEEEGGGDNDEEEVKNGWMWGG